MKLSIIIVNWNVRELLETCMESLFLYAPKAPFEVCVIDNNSHDDSCEMIQEKFPKVKLIANNKNVGFAAACNQGVRATSGEYVLFLNCDTLLTPISFEPLISILDSQNQVALAAPQLLSRDGSMQKSVRRFPTPFQALCEFFRFQRPKEYSYIETTSVEQPMGAALCVRRNILESVGVFDERFFIWYEEVDLCKRIRDAGHDIVYVPDAQIVHVGGESFAQHPTLRKQKFYYKSYSSYLWKHWRWKALLPVVLMKIYVGILSAPFFWMPLLLIAGAELLSFAGHFFSPIQLFGFIFFPLLVFVLSLRNLSYGIMALVVELIIGSKGHLFDLQVGDFTLSIRMALFIVILLAWLVHVFRPTRSHAQLADGDASILGHNAATSNVVKRSKRFLFFKSQFITFYALLGLFVLWGVLWALIKNNSFSALFADANAWLFLLIAFPLYDAIRSHHAIRQLAIVASAAVVAQFIKTSAVLYVMSHKSFGYDVMYPLYRWIRDTGVGEITQFEWGATRVFFQSGIYPLLLLFILIPTLVASQNTRVREWFCFHWKTLMLFSGCAVIVLLGFSRSFWVAAFLTMLLIVALLLVKKKWKSLFRLAGIGIASLVVAFAWIITVTFIPLPSQTGGMGLDVFARRLEDINSEAAAASRWSLLPVLNNAIKEHPFTGYGFGKTVTYVSYDPRVREQNKSGMFTTFSFEWGWLDFIVKMGIGGLLTYLFLIGALLTNGIRQMRQTSDHWIAGILLGLVALAIVHVFTPYLNHPLGIAYILFAGLVFDVMRTNKLEPEETTK